VELINFALIKHPLNWLVILLMVVLFGIALHLVFDFYGVSPGK
jgi:hypothetical protein